MDSTCEISSLLGLLQSYQESKKECGEGESNRYQ